MNGNLVLMPLINPNQEEAAVVFADKVKALFYIDYYAN